LAVGASMTSFAARGWVAEGDQWYYYDSNGDYVTDKWKSYNGNYFYLGDEGYMLTNELIEDGNNYYYVDANGAMVKNCWVAVPAEDDEEQDVEYRWYYFGTNGKAYRDHNKKTINGKKYGFDVDGKMLFGFVQDKEVINDQDDPILEADRYYGTNDDGAMHTGWLKYEEALDASGYDDQYYWFWFDSKGVKYTNGVKKIGGKQYSFNADGAMQTKWDNTTYDKATGAQWGYFSGEEDGHLVKNEWIWADAENKFLGSDADEHWFYAEKHGELAKNKVKKINGKYYAFDEDGVMLSDFVWLGDNSIKKTNDGKILYHVDIDKVSKEQLLGAATYNGLDLTDVDGDGNKDSFAFFSDDDEKDGAAKTGTNLKLEIYDDTYTFGFDKNTGMCLDALKNNKVWNRGMLQTAGDDKYRPVQDGTGATYLVGTTGTRMKPGTRTYKDDNDVYWLVVSDGDAFEIYYADSSNDVKDATKRTAFDWSNNPFNY
jgi:glucan-binding YG repeat protein